MYIFYRYAYKIVLQTSIINDYFSYIPKNKKKIIFNPIDLKEFPIKKDFVDKEKIIINTSRHTKDKNQILLLKAFNEIIDKKGYILELYGDGPEHKKYINFIKNNHMENHVFVYPATDKILDKVNNSRIFVLSSNTEGLPNSLIEAVTLGCLCISTNSRSGGASEIMKYNSGGYLIPLNDIFSLKNAIEKLIVKESYSDENERNRLELINKISIEKVILMWEELI